MKDLTKGNPTRLMLSFALPVCLVGGYKEKDMMPAEIFSEAVELEFEGEYFRAPKGYDTYLTIEYGDYMTLPPVEQRVTHHDFKAWWKTK